MIPTRIQFSYGERQSSEQSKSKNVSAKQYINGNSNTSMYSVCFIAIPPHELGSMILEDDPQ